MPELKLRPPAQLPQPQLFRLGRYPCLLVGLYCDTLFLYKNPQRA